MRILGIDPGSQVMGFGLLQLNQELSIIDFGHLKLKSCRAFGKKLETIFEATHQLIEQLQPNCIAIESQFVRKNVKTTMQLTMVKGVILTAAAQANCELFEYEPTKVKAAISRGNASKQTIQRMVQLLFDLEELPEPADAADALAIAYAHAKSLQIVNLVSVR